MQVKGVKEQELHQIIFLWQLISTRPRGVFEIVVLFGIVVKLYFWKFLFFLVLN